MNPYESEVDMAYERGYADAVMKCERARQESEDDDAYEEMLYKKLYADAVEYYGVESQTMKCIEECSELIQAICKEDDANTIEEMVDVEICLEQMKIIMLQDADDIEAFNVIKEYKRDRLARWIKNG